MVSNLGTQFEEKYDSGLTISLQQKNHRQNATIFVHLFGSSSVASRIIIISGIIAVAYTAIVIVSHDRVSVPSVLKVLYVYRNFRTDVLNIEKECVSVDNIESFQLSIFSIDC